MVETHLCSHPPRAAHALVSQLSATMKTDTADTLVHMSSHSGVLISMGWLGQRAHVFLIRIAVASFLCSERCHPSDVPQHQAVCVRHVPAPSPNVSMGYGKR